MARDGACRSGLVTPYVDDVQARIIGNYAAAGFECVAERHPGIRDDFSFATLDDETLRTLMHEVATVRPHAVVILCTNLRGAPLAAAFEAETGIAVYDSVATVNWKALRLAGVDASRVRGWRRLFAGSL